MRISVWLIGLFAAQLLYAEDSAYQRGVRVYEQGSYQEAVSIFELEVQKNPDDSESHHWLGKAIGRLAEQAAWYNAFTLARRAGKEMEKAVDLNPYNTAAVKSLLQFYEQAPALVGGGKDKADRLRERMKKMELKIQE